MIIDRILTGLIATIAVAVSAAVVFVSVVFAVFALLEPLVGPAGAVAVIAGVVAAVLVVAGFVLLRRKAVPVSASKPESGGGDGGVPARLMGMVRDRPIVAASAALAAGILTWRNPRLVGAAMRALDRRES